MSAIDPAILKWVRQWISYAEDDLRLARHALSLSSNVPYRLIAYHAQQCAEKYLKAYLVFHNTDFPYTHNIKALLKLCGNHAAWASELKDAEELTPFAITARYPGEEIKVSKKAALGAIDLAEKVRETVRKALAEEGVTVGEASSL